MINHYKMTKKTLRTEPEKRLYSLDALRGFDMFWITGGGLLAVAISKMAGLEWLEAQMHHAEWDGFRFYDLIFPLFMFISGVAIPFSIGSKIKRNIPSRKIIRKVFFRLIALIILGIIYNGAFKNGFAEARIASVLGQIGIAYFFASLIYIYFKSLPSLIIWLGSILTVIGIIQLLIPVPGVGAGILTPEGCINGYIDRMLLPGRLYGKVFDPEGILCSISATGITLMGTIAGTILKIKNQTGLQKIGWLIIAGTASVILALIFSTFYPVIKSCWTSTFNLLAGGISFYLLSVFYLVIDHWGFKWWAFYFRIIGINSIFIYLFTRIVDTKAIAAFFFGWIINMAGDTGEIILFTGNLIIIWILLYYMYKKNIFFRV